jgi:hypothetical protein
MMGMAVRCASIAQATTMSTFLMKARYQTVVGQPIDVTGVCIDVFAVYWSTVAMKVRFSSGVAQPPLGTDTREFPL